VALEVQKALPGHVSDLLHLDGHQSGLASLETGDIVEVGPLVDGHELVPMLDVDLHRVPIRVSHLQRPPGRIGAAL
jgi:hypothetical protein